MKKYTHEKAHEEIDYIFKTLLPQRGMAERPEQIRLCHSILDAMLDGSIALCDAGTGIGKTFAYLTAGILHGKCRAAEGKPQRPTIVWNYIGELIFNMLVLVGAIKMSDRLVRELMGLG